jgi:polysaccharide biosynthesis protein PslH
MKVLQICPKPPMPPVDGGCAASLQLSKDLMEAGNELEVISLATQKHPFKKDGFDVTFLQQTKFRAFEIDTRSDLSAVLLSFFSPSSIQQSRFFDRRFEKFLEGELRKYSFDFIVLDGLMTAIYLNAIKEYSTARVIYRSHNIESSMLLQKALVSPNPLKKWYLKMQAVKLKEFETGIWSKSDLIFSISEKDSVEIKAAIGDESRVLELPFGIRPIPRKEPEKENTLFHLGAMDWQPNVEGIRWFLQEAWPSIRNEHPGTEIHLGGKDIRQSFSTRVEEGIFVHSTVPDATAFMEQYDIMVVPLKSGSGLRIKILQGLSLGKPIISTTKGAEGIPFENDRELLIADEAAGFVRQAGRLLKSVELKKKLATNGQQLVRDHFSTETNVKRLREWMTAFSLHLVQNR